MKIDLKAMSDAFLVELLYRLGPEDDAFWKSTSSGDEFDEVPDVQNTVFRGNDEGAALSDKIFAELVSRGIKEEDQWVRAQTADSLRAVILGRTFRRGDAVRDGFPWVCVDGRGNYLYGVDAAFLDALEDAVLAALRTRPEGDVRVFPKNSGCHAYVSGAGVRVGCSNERIPLADVLFTISEIRRLLPQQL